MNSFVGIGYRKEFSDDFVNREIIRPSFVEVAPENWMGIGGYWRKVFEKITEEFPVTSHGLSLSLGSPDDLDWSFLKKIKTFLREFNITIYSEHLSYSKCDNAHLYDLLPIPFREDAIKHISRRIRDVQDYLEMKIAIENVSYYTPVAAEMSESQFIASILEESDCHLLLDVNNVYVNAFNHGYDARDFISSLPLDKVSYIHMAGHEQVEPDLIIDTHGQNIVYPVYELFDFSVERLHPVPVLLERDFNLPAMFVLQQEIDKLNQITQKHWNTTNVFSKGYIPTAI
ncbi:MAG: DUF692 domain-containing protein [Bacteroidales bacterium]|nr:DUF692 domain-containing protein [Bacteroidales bacterium]